MIYGIYDSNGNLVSSGGSSGGSGGSGGGTGGSSATYDRMDIGPIWCDPVASPNYFNDFIGSSNEAYSPFRYRFPRNGWVLGLSLGGDTAEQSGQFGFQIVKYDSASHTTSPVLTPTSPGATMTVASPTFNDAGAIVMAPTPIAFNANDTVGLQVQNLTGGSIVSFSFYAFILVALAPQ